MLNRRTDNRQAALAVSPTTVAVGLVFCFVFLGSFFPVLIAKWGTESPFLFATAWQAGAVIGMLAMLVIGYRALFFNRSVWRLLLGRTLSWSMLFWMLAQCDGALFAWSAGIIDVSISTVLYQLSPVMTILLIERLFRSEGRYRGVGLLQVVAFGLGAAGVAAVVASQSGGLGNPLSFNGISTLAAAGGMALALAAAASASCESFGFSWAASLAVRLPPVPGHDRASLEVFAVVAGAVICSLFAIALIGSIGLARQEPVEPNSLMIGLLGGPLLSAVPTILWRKANLMTGNLGVNVVRYLLPLLSLGWLFAFSLAGDVDARLVFFGALMVVGANLFVYLEGRDARQAATADNPGGRDIDVPIADLIADGESEHLEFKSSLRMNLNTRTTDRRVELGALKTLAAFMNSTGGVLVVGVSDDGRPVGVQVDGFASEDRMGLHLRNIAITRMGPAAMSCVHARFETYCGVRVMAVRCDPSPVPVYVRGPDESVEFYIRAGPSSSSLSVRDSHEYIVTRF